MTLSESIAGMDWAVREIRETSEELLDLLDHKDAYQIRLRKMTMENRKKEWLAARVLLKELLGEEKEIAYTPAGRPYLTDRSCHISISHTKNYVAVIADRQSPVGIDIEYISPRIHKIRSRFMNEEENNHISSAYETEHLLLHWSAKESIFKALGEESVDFQTQLHIKPFEPVSGILSSFEAEETRTEKQHLFSVHYLLQPEYVITFTKSSPQ